MSKEVNIYIGRQSLNRYIGLCLAMFHSGYNKVNVKARGGKIPKAIDVVERLRRNFMSEVKVDKVIIDSDIITTSEGRLRRVSTITIILKRGDEW